MLRCRQAHVADLIAHVWKVFILHSPPTPYTLHTPHSDLHPPPSTLHPLPYTLHPTPYTLRPTPHTLQGEPSKTPKMIHGPFLEGACCPMASPSLPLTAHATDPAERQALTPCVAPCVEPSGDCKVWLRRICQICDMFEHDQVIRTCCQARASRPKRPDLPHRTRPFLTFVSSSHVDLSFRALSERLQFIVRRHTFNELFLPISIPFAGSWRQPETVGDHRRQLHGLAD